MTGKSSCSPSLRSLGGNGRGERPAGPGRRGGGGFAASTPVLLSDISCPRHGTVWLHVRMHAASVACHRGQHGVHLCASFCLELVQAAVRPHCVFPALLGWPAPVCCWTPSWAWSAPPSSAASWAPRRWQLWASSPFVSTSQSEQAAQSSGMCLSLRAGGMRGRRRADTPLAGT